MSIKSSISIFYLVVASMLVISGCTTDSIKCTLKGEVIDRPQSTRLILLKQGENVRSQGIYIPITNGKFEYVLDFNHEEEYQLVFSEELEQNEIRFLQFFPYNGIIHFTLHSSERFTENIIEGGKLNREYQDYFSNIIKMEETVENKLFAKIGQYIDDNYSEVLKTNETFEADLFAKIEQLSKDGFDIYPILEEMEYSANQEIEDWTFQYITENPTIVGYSILVSKVSFIVQLKTFQKVRDIAPYAHLFETVYSPQYSDHPYTAKMIELLTTSSFKEGGFPYIDFTAIDLDEKPVRFSEVIAGKYAVLHLWASWCSPCRKKGKELIPVYEEFREKGFVVVGVAREKSISTAEAAVRLDKYPWQILVELNDVEQIWDKYGIGNAGGSTFLIDEKGTIIAVNPTIDEIRDFLINNL